MPEPSPLPNLSAMRSLVATAARVCVFGCLVVAACATTPTSATPSSRPPAEAAAGRPSLFAYPWVWTDDRGQPVRFAQWRGETVVVTVFYTSCRKTCPRTLKTLRTVEASFEHEHRAAHFLVVTLDPSNDTPDRLHEFRRSENLPEAWHLLVGSETQTRDLVDLLDIHVMDLDPHLVHEGKIVVFDSRGMAARSFTSSGDEISPL